MSAILLVMLLTRASKYWQSPFPSYSLLLPSSLPLHFPLAFPFLPLFLRFHPFAFSFDSLPFFPLHFPFQSEKVKIPGQYECTLRHTCRKTRAGKLEIRISAGYPEFCGYPLDIRWISGGGISNFPARFSSLSSRETMQK